MFDQIQHEPFLTVASKSAANIAMQVLSDWIDLAAKCLTGHNKPLRHLLFPCRGLLLLETASSEAFSKSEFYGYFLVDATKREHFFLGNKIC